MQTNEKTKNVLVCGRMPATEMGICPLAGHNPRGGPHVGIRQFTCRNHRAVGRRGDPFFFAGFYSQIQIQKKCEKNQICS